MRVWMIKLV